jgi:lambda repressor-like predicted transcriptional regulator
MERTLNADDVLILRQRPVSLRLRVAHRLAGASFREVAERAGISPVHLTAAAGQRQRLSLRAKLHVARILSVPAAVIWPELETLALEALHGAMGGRR